MKKNIILLVLLSIILISCSNSKTTNEVPQIKATDTISVPTNSPIPPTQTYAPIPTPLINGPKIVFASHRGKNSQQTGLYILNLETNEIKELETGIEGTVLPKWSPDGSRVLFAVRDPWNLYIINEDGSGLTQLTDFSSNNGDWSPDGTKIVFQSDAQNEPKDTPDIYVIDVNGENLTEILDLPEVADFSPRWAAKSDQIMFLSDRTGHYEVFLMNADGSNVTQITDGGASITHASISPDGERIAFVYPQGGQNTDLYTIDKSGDVGTVIRLTSDATFDDNPCWSPDSSKIIFNSDRGGNMDLWMINADGSEPVQLTDDEEYDNYPDYWEPQDDFNYPPDTNYLVFLKDTCSNLSMRADFKHRRSESS